MIMPASQVTCEFSGITCDDRELAERIMQHGDGVLPFDLAHAAQNFLTAQNEFDAALADWDIERG